MIDPVSQYSLTVDALARANGPYLVDAGALVTFTGGPDRPDTSYSWQFGDGATASGRVVTHTYADDGVYVARLTTSVSEAGGVTTHHFALVRARNVPPVVAPHPAVSCDEGTQTEYVVGFRDQEWPDTHCAWFDWGDDSLPTEAAVVETHDEPAAVGTATARHAYCRQGTFTVTVTVKDDDGGVGTTTFEVSVANVAPTVVADPDLFAYPCSPLPAVATFTDPGWCERHTATWDFGDASPVLPATVVERHQPPAGTGYAVATHTYRTLGNFFARCVVTDEYGASGEDWLVVRVVDVVNKDFEHGFRRRTVGEVASGWEPYGQAGNSVEPAVHLETPASADLTSPGRYAAEQDVVHGGQRSQRIEAPAGGRAGIWQRIGTNVGWEYQLTAFCALDESGGGRARLGVDPHGGVDPGAATVEWTDANARREWTALTVRAVARAERLTVFLEVGPPPAQPRAVLAQPPVLATESRLPAVVWWDDVDLQATPCPARARLPRAPKPPQSRQQCTDWAAMKEQRVLGVTFDQDGFRFTSLNQKQPLRVMPWGSSPPEGKLALGVDGVEVALPFPAERVVARVVTFNPAPVSLAGTSDVGAGFGPVTGTARSGVEEELELEGSQITTVTLRGGRGEAALVRICAFAAGPTTAVGHEVVNAKPRD